MIFGSNFKIKTIITGIVFLCLASFSYASVNSVSSVSVNSDNSGNYKILLKTDKSAKIKKSSGEDTLYLTLNSTLPSATSEIIYDNADGINNITMQKKNSDDTLIILQGKNIENAKVFVKDLSTGKTVEAGTKNDIFFITDKKLTGYSLLTFVLMFLAIFAMRPKEKLYEESTVSNKSVLGRTAGNITLRHKAMSQRGNVPSINAGVTGRFASAKITRPEEFAYEEDHAPEKIRKAG